MKKYIVLLLAVISLVLTACSPSEFTVTFNSDGGTSVSNQTIVDGSTIEEPSVPTKEGFDFLYWYSDDNTTEFDFDTEISSDIELNALWDEILIFTVDFDSMGGTEVSVQNIVEGEVATEPDLPIKAEFNFVYWYTDDINVAFDFDTEINSDTELTALWSAKDVYTVTFDVIGGTETVSQAVIDGNVATDPGEIEKYGFIFMYWYATDDTTAYDFTTAITDDITLSALWVEKEIFTVTFDSTIGSVIDSVELYVDEAVELPTEPVAGTKNFVYWYLDSESVEFDFSTPITSDITLTAKWSDKDLFDITFDSNGGEDIDAQVVMDGYLASVPVSPSIFAYEFVRWYETDDSVPFDFTSPITEDVVLTAFYTLLPVYAVSFDTLGGSVIDSQNIIEDESIIEPVDPTREGYRFMYWYETDNTIPYDVESVITGDTTLTAKWEILYTLVFDSDGGDEVETQSLLTSEVTIEPEVPTKYGRRFIRWYVTDSETAFVFGDTLTENVTVTALWQTVFTVKFYSLGVEYDLQIIDDGDLVIIPDEPSKADHVFKYWYTTDSETPFDFNTPITYNLNIRARWETPTERLIMADMDAYAESLVGLDNLLPTPARGSVNLSTLRYYSESLYISDGGVILSLPEDVPEGTTGTWKLKFTLDGESYYREYEIPLYHADEIEIAESRVLPFENLTTEYDVADSSISLYYEQDGFVPYVNVEDFLGLLDGFIDPSLLITFTQDNDTLEIFYQYYDEDEDYTYDLILNIDATENTITTNDPGFYWAYIYSTETNYGRHIEYIQDHPNESSIEGSDVIYDLDEYNMDIVMYEGEILLPYYITNQLFAGSAYYNVYYNYDGLYGIYSLPSSSSKEMRTIMGSTMNNEDLPVDLLLHTFDMLAFDLDNLYGLKDIMEVDSYYDLLYSMKDDLLVTDPEEFEIAIRDLLLKGLDEPHTSYGYHSYYNNSTYTGPTTNSLAVYGSRFTQWYYDGLVATDDAIGARWGTAITGWNVTVRPDYWFLSDEVVMLSLDGFVTSDIEESSTHDALIPESMMKLTDITNVLPEITQGNKFFYYNNSDSNNNIVDILVKGVDETYVDTYIAALISSGYSYVYETTTNPLLQYGYYMKTVSDGIDDGDYMVIVHYDSEYSLFHVGIANVVPLSYSSIWAVRPDVKELIDADSAVYMEFMLQEIEEEHPGITDIILDISWNTGGNVGALYRVLGFITDQPFAVSGIDGDTGGASTYYVDITDIPDYSHLTWHLLTTPTSFSAANSLANIFKNNDLGNIIGVQTGGGACSITPILLPNGTAFTTSSNNISAYRTGLGTEEDPYVYHDVEFGITPDYEIDIEDIFSVSILLDIINETE